MHKKILILLLSVLLTACANSTSSDSKAETEAVSETTTTTAAVTTDDSEQTTTTTTTSISEKETDSSSRTETSTKSSTESTTTTTSQPVSTTSKAITQASTKAAQKPVVTTTTTTSQRAVATTTTARQNTNSNVKPSGLTRLEEAVWELSFYGKDQNTTYLIIVREELIKYGQAYCKSNPACFKLFTINTKLYPYYDKDGKPLYAACDMKGRNIAVGSSVEFPYDEINAPFNYTTSQERLQACRAFINRMKLLIERVLCNALHHGIANMEWYITYGFEAAGTDWVVMAHMPDGKTILFD